MTDELRKETQRLTGENIDPRDVSDADIERRNDHIEALQSEIDRLRAELAERERKSHNKGWEEGFADAQEAHRVESETDLSDAEVIRQAESAGMRWLPPDPDADDGEGFPGAFDLASLESVKRLLTPSPRPAVGASDEPQVPEGWKLVPVQPTPEMRHAAAERRYGWEHGGTAGAYEAVVYYNQSIRPHSDILEQTFVEEWRQALSAAPTPPAEGKAGLAKGCHRSHPHENMSPECEAKIDESRKLADATECKDVRNALDRAARRLEQQARELFDAGDYNAEFPYEDARLIRRAQQLVAASGDGREVMNPRWGTISWGEIASDALYILPVVLEEREEEAGEQDDVLRDLIDRIKRGAAIAAQRGGDGDA